MGWLGTVVRGERGNRLAVKTASSCRVGNIRVRLFTCRAHSNYKHVPRAASLRPAFFTIPEKFYFGGRHWFVIQPFDCLTFKAEFPLRAVSYLEWRGESCESIPSALFVSQEFSFLFRRCCSPRWGQCGFYTATITNEIPSLVATDDVVYPPLQSFFLNICIDI